LGKKNQPISATEKRKAGQGAANKTSLDTLSKLNLEFVGGEGLAK